jgi:hypothetical protein
VRLRLAGGAAPTVEILICPRVVAVDVVIRTASPGPRLISVLVLVQAHVRRNGSPSLVWGSDRVRPPWRREGAKAVVPVAFVRLVWGLNIAALSLIRIHSVSGLVESPAIVGVDARLRFANGLRRWQIRYHGPA